MARHSDFVTSFQPHPDTGELLLRTDERSITQSIRNLILTDPEERPFENQIGCGVRRTLFDQFDAFTEDHVRDMILETLQREPRASIVNVGVRANEPAGVLFIAIEYVHENSTIPVVVQLTLSRVR